MNLILQKVLNLILGIWVKNNGASVTATYGVLSISVADLTSNIQVYPNPAQNEINFAYNFEKPSGAKANIMDLSGRTVFTKDFGTQASGNQNFTIPVADLPNGNYTLEFVTEGSRGVSKFTVTK
ncbi:MAG: T9SS type A sorting domain-containing protein [Taibaiella sp.]|nr:T9SS type A sorting domain-containing protein [Taibaiella sp.]